MGVLNRNHLERIKSSQQKLIFERPLAPKNSSLSSIIQNIEGI